MRKILKSIFRQFRNPNNRFAPNEPRAFIGIEKNRSLEVIKTPEGFYFCILHCNEEEFDNDTFYSTMGVIKFLSTNNYSIKELKNVIKDLILYNKQV